jgi:proteic killer suppression protein
MIVSFADHATEDVFDGVDSPRARRCCPRQLWPRARRLLDALAVACSVDELRSPPGNTLKRLQGDRFGQYSIRINQQYRLCFSWKSGNAYEVEITDYH